MKSARAGLSEFERREGKRGRSQRELWQTMAGMVLFFGLAGVAGRVNAQATSFEWLTETSQASLKAAATDGIENGAPGPDLDGVSAKNELLDGGSGLPAPQADLSAPVLVIDEPGLADTASAGVLAALQAKLAKSVPAKAGVDFTSGDSVELDGASVDADLMQSITSTFVSDVDETVMVNSDRAAAAMVDAINKESLTYVYGASGARGILGKLIQPMTAGATVAVLLLALTTAIICWRLKEWHEELPTRLMPILKRRRQAFAEAEVGRASE
jgi:hypothetical protein